MATHSSTLAWKIPWTEEPDPSPWGREESDTTEQLHFHFLLSCIGEGNGNPLQCSYFQVVKVIYLSWILTKKNIINLTLVFIICCQVTSVVSDSVRPHRQQPIRLLCPWDSPGKNTGVGCHFLLQCMKVKSESEVAQSCSRSEERRVGKEC